MFAPARLPNQLPRDKAALIAGATSGINLAIARRLAADWTGGVLQIVDMAGPRAFAERAAELTQRYGERFAPPALLLGKAERSERLV
jgi:NAD(P)-dependent dehydrogenase (short-subunit alcohol dehydrogenase family)